MTREEKAAVIRAVQQAREALDEAMAILIPDDEDAGCSHPADKIIDDSSMGEDLFRCGICGAESTTPFHSQE